MSQPIVSAETSNVDERSSPLSGLYAMLNIFIDPAASARQIRAPYAWLWPVVTLVVIFVVVGTLNAPFTKELIQARFAASGQPDPDKALAMANRASSIGLVAGPIFVLGMIALIAWLVSAIANVFGKSLKFRDVFSLAACASLIGALQYIASYIVIASKGEQIENPEQLRPPFGLDIFMPGLHGVALAIVGFFSIFQIWYLLAFTIAMAALARSSKLQAFGMITPAWVIPLLLTVLGAAMQR